MVAIQITRLSKRYGPTQAVRDLTLTVPAGALFAFLGANGAGKSTTIACATTTLAPTSGTIRVCGFDTVSQAHRVRFAMGVVFQESLLDPLLSVRENLLIRAGFYALKGKEAQQRITEISHLVALEDFL